MIWFWLAVLAGLTARVIVTYRRYNRAGLITGNKVAAYIRAASADIDRRNHHGRR